MTQPIHPILERVAIAMARINAESDWKYYLPEARAAIQALSEPDEGMKLAGADELFGSVEDDWSVDARRVFQAMLKPLLGDEGMVEDGGAMVADGTYGSRSIYRAMLRPLIGEGE